MTLPTRLLGAAACALALTACSTDMMGSGDSEIVVAETVSTDDAGQVVVTEIVDAAVVRAPDFTLSDTNGNEHNLASYLADGKTVVLEWFNPDCPYTRAFHTPERRMASYYERVKEDDVVWLAINSGAAGKQGAGLERNQTAFSEWDVAYPLLLDPSGETGKAYGAKTTPHMFVITPAGGIVYAGAIDDSGGRGAANTNYVLQALAELADGQAVSQPLSKSYGCSVKYAN